MKCLCFILYVDVLVMLGPDMVLGELIKTIRKEIKDEVGVVWRAVRQEDAHRRMKTSNATVRTVAAVLHAFVHMVGSQMRQAIFQLDGGQWPVAPDAALRAKGESLWATISWHNEQWRDGGERVNLRGLPYADINLHMARRLSMGMAPRIYLDGSHSAIYLVRLSTCH